MQKFCQVHWSNIYWGKCGGSRVGGRPRDNWHSNITDWTMKNMVEAEHETVDRCNGDKSWQNRQRCSYDMIMVMDLKKTSEEDYQEPVLAVYTHMLELQPIHAPRTSALPHTRAPWLRHRWRWCPGRLQTSLKSSQIIVWTVNATVSHPDTHRCQHYLFQAGNPTFRTPFLFPAFQLKCSAVLHTCFALIVPCIYLYYLVCLEFKSVSIRAPS